MPSSEADFLTLFPGENACERAIFAIRFPNGFVCPRCGGRRCYRRSTRRTLLCANCRTQLELTAGTLLHRTHLPLLTWFSAIFLMTSSPCGLSIKEFRSNLHIGRLETAMDLMQRIRWAMAAADMAPLEGVIILGDNRLDLGWPKSGPLIAGAFEVQGAKELGVELGRMRLGVLTRPIRGSLEAFVRRCVAPGSVVMSDGRARFAFLDAAGYIHVPHLDPRNHSTALFYDVLHARFLAIAEELIRTHRRRTRHLQEYLDEFAFRQNSRLLRRGEGFHAVLNAAVNWHTHRGAFRRGG